MGSSVCGEARFTSFHRAQKFEDRVINWFTGALVYIMIWWVVIFAVLPWGVKVPDEPEPGHASSAPETPLLGRKLLITTAISTVLWVIAFLVIESDLLPLRPT